MSITTAGDMDTTFTEYKGKVLSLRYPSFLKIKAQEPQWYAAGSRRKAGVMIEVNPSESAIEAFGRMIRSPLFSNTPGASIVREGKFCTANGIVGHERVTRMLETRGWGIDGKFKERDIIIQIWTADSEWHDGRIWLDMLNSVEMI